MHWLRLKHAQSSISRCFFLDHISQQSRGKKWSCKHGFGVNNTAQQRAAIYEKRLKRRARNQHLKLFLTSDGQDSRKTPHFEDSRLAKSRLAKDCGNSHKSSHRLFSGSINSDDGRKRAGETPSWQRRHRRRGYSHWHAERERQWFTSHESQGSKFTETEFLFSRFTAFKERETIWQGYQEIWSQAHFQDYFSRVRQTQNTQTSSRAWHSTSQLHKEDSTTRMHLQNLGLQSIAGLTSDALKKHFHKCALLWHPDKHNGNEQGRAQAEEKFKHIKSSYQFLQTCVDS